MSFSLSAGACCALEAAAAIALPILLTGLLPAVQAAGHEAGPVTSAADAQACIFEGAILEGQRQPPTPDEMSARKACRGHERGAPGVDFSPQAGDKLDQIYHDLMSIDHSQGGGGGPPPPWQSAAKRGFAAAINVPHRKLRQCFES